MLIMLNDVDQGRPQLKFRWKQMQDSNIGGKLTNISNLYYLMNLRYHLILQFCSYIHVKSTS
jgi:hypothetical protein